MKQITINVDPPQVTIDDELSSSFRCDLLQVRRILELLGCGRWPLEDCLVRLGLADDDARTEKILDILLSKVAPKENYKAA